MPPTNTDNVIRHPYVEHAYSLHAYCHRRNIHILCTHNTHGTRHVRDENSLKHTYPPIDRVGKVSHLVHTSARDLP